MLGHRINRNWVKDSVAMSLCMVLLIGLAGGCWGKAKEEKQAVAPAERTEEPVATSEQDSEPLFEPGQPVIEVLMKVGQEVITTSDALTALAEPLGELGRQARGDQFRAQAEQMILQYLRVRSGEILLINEAQSALDESQETMVQRLVEAHGQRLLQQCDNSQTRLENKLREEGTTLEEMLKDYRRALVVEQYLREQFRSRLKSYPRGVAYAHKSTAIQAQRQCPRSRLKVPHYPGGGHRQSGKWGICHRTTLGFT